MTKTFRSAAAFKTSLEARMRTQAAERGVPFQTLQLKLVMERLLARLFHEPSRMEVDAQVDFPPTRLPNTRSPRLPQVAPLVVSRSPERPANPLRESCKHYPHPCPTVPPSREMKVRSVKQTEKNLDQQLFGAVARKPGRIEITETTISYEV